jgi:uncharacterized PurR-regulated membrane protein YhhQ (DUF165 family)
MPTLFQITGLSVGGIITIAVGVTLARMVGQIYDVAIQKRFEKFLKLHHLVVNKAKKMINRKGKTNMKKKEIAAYIITAVVFFCAFIALIKYHNYYIATHPAAQFIMKKIITGG